MDKSSGYKIQSVIFSTKKWTPETATDWLLSHNHKANKIDMKTDKFLRFRQMNPKPLEKKGYHFINKKLGSSGIELVIGYPNVKGGKISISNLKQFITNSYSKKPDKNVDGYELDNDLTNDIAKVYYNKDKNHAVITHRGTSGVKDWANNAAYALGLYKYTDRYKRGKKAQEETNKKYGKENVSTVGHSQGAVLARDLGTDTKEIINLNPAYINEKPKKNEYNIKSSADVVSVLKPTHTKDIEVKATTYNPLTEHSTSILDRLNQDMEVGAGRYKNKKKSFTNKQMKSIADHTHQCIMIISEWDDNNPDKIKIMEKIKKMI